jgi:prepilin-type N-terminal cleavage/methylation domain-containing protein
MRISMTPSTDRRTTTCGQGGLSLVEIILVVAIMGILAVLATPMFLRYYQAAEARAAAQGIVSYLNQARQLAIMQNRSICVHIDPTTMHYHQGSCAGPQWVAPGTDASGDIKLLEGITLTRNQDPVFTYLGAASQGATYTLTHTKSGIQMTVVVSNSGRVSVGP